MDDFYSTLFACLMGDNIRSEVVGRDEVNDYTIDTCYTLDQGWETAVWYKENRIVIVARYPDKETAIQGHREWVETCTTNRPTHAFSPQTDKYESFGVE